ncbi:MAG: twin-arginine translocase TatA/TatE family subunit [Thermoflexus sp.]|uniref:Sec-independent protein translocase subunit TatA/TatB n=1 Tax=Thermoflexus sp. TaxID=1969742 RepID=UPI003332A3B1
MIRIGAEELLLILFLALLLFGPGRLSAVARELGQSVREFRRGLQEDRTEAPPGSDRHPPDPPA